MAAPTESFGRLIDLVRNYTGEELIWEVNVILRAAEVPRTQLGGYGRLGWTTWLKTKPFERDAADMVVHESYI